MAILDFIVGFGISYSDDGAPGKLDKLARAARTLNPLVDQLAASAKAAASSVLDLGEAGKAASVGLGDLAATSRAASAASRSAASAHRAQAASLFDVAAGANAAAAGMARFYAMVAAGSGAQGGARFAPQAALGGAALGMLPGAASGALVRSPYSLYGARQFALPTGAGSPYGPIPQPAWRSSAAAAIGGAPLLALPGGVDPNWQYNKRAWYAGQRAQGTSYGSGPTIAAPGYVPPGARPPHGGGGGRGGWFPVSGERAAGFVVRGAKYGVEAGLGLGVDALYEAGKLQQKMTLIQVATGANEAQKRRIEQLAYQISDMTAQSVAQSAGVIGVMASSGINDPKTLLAKDKQGRTFAEIVAKFADVQYLKGGVPFETGSKELIQLAHLYGAYTPDRISHIANQVTKLSFMMPDSLNRYLTQAGYYVPMLSKLGVPEDQSLVMGAFLDRMGLGRGKGGTSVQNFVSAMMKPLTARTATGRGAGVQLKALEELGIYDRHGRENPKIFRSDKDGHSVIDLFAAFDALNKAIHEQTKELKGDVKARKERQLIGDFQKAFGTQGQRSGLLGTDRGIEQLRQMIATLPKMPGVEAGQSMFMRNFNSQFVRAWSNFQSLATEVGGTAIPGMTKAAVDLGDAFHVAQGWLHQHGDLERSIQREILADVKGTEQWLVAHRKDFQQFGSDAKGAVLHLHDVGTQLGYVGDGAILAGKALRLLADDLSVIPQTLGGIAWIADKLDPFRGLGSYPGARDRTVPLSPIGYDQNGSPIYPSDVSAGRIHDGRKTLSGYGDLPAFSLGVGPTRARAGAEAEQRALRGRLGELDRLLQPRNPPHRQHTQRVVHEHHVHLHGGNAVARHHVANLVHDVLTVPGDPRHASARRGSISTSPRQPTRHTTTNP